VFEGQAVTCIRFAGLLGALLFQVGQDRGYRRHEFSFSKACRQVRNSGSPLICTRACGTGAAAVPPGRRFRDGVKRRRPFWLRGFGSLVENFFDVRASALWALAVEAGRCGKGKQQNC
jgi:hypothetical protein